MQPSDGPINASAGATVFTGTLLVVQVAMGEGAPIGPAIQRSPQDVVEESKTKLEFLGLGLLKEVVVLDLGILLVYA